MLPVISDSRQIVAPRMNPNTTIVSERLKQIDESENRRMISMKTMSLALSAMLLIAFGSICATQAQSGATDDGIDTVEVVKATATVEKIDLEKRKVTLLLDDGKKKTYKVDGRVQNLAQVKVGDHLEMSFTEEIAHRGRQVERNAQGRVLRTSFRGAQWRQTRRRHG